MMPPKRIFTQGTTPDGRLDCVEYSLQKFSKRLNRVCEVYIPPFPISSFVSAPDEYGVFFRYIFPVNGRVDSIVIQSINDAVPLEVTFLSSNGSNIREVIANRGESIDIGVEVEIGDRMIVSTTIRDTALWVGVSLTINPNDVAVHRILIEDLEKGAKDAEAKEG